MSGGHFDYKQGWLDWELAEELDHLIEDNENKESDDFGNPRGRHYPPEILEKFKEASELARRLSHMVHCIDYLLCGDYGEDSFLEQWKKRMKELDDE